MDHIGIIGIARIGHQADPFHARRCRQFAVKIAIDRGIIDIKYESPLAHLAVVGAGDEFPVIRGQNGQGAFMGIGVRGLVGDGHLGGKFTAGGHDQRLDDFGDQTAADQKSHHRDPQQKRHNSCSSFHANLLILFFSIYKTCH